MGNVSAVC